MSQDSLMHGRLSKVGLFQMTEDAGARRHGNRLQPGRSGFDSHRRLSRERGNHEDRARSHISGLPPAALLAERREYERVSEPLDLNGLTDLDDLAGRLRDVRARELGGRADIARGAGHVILRSAGRRGPARTPGHDPRLQPVGRPGSPRWPADRVRLRVPRRSGPTGPRFLSTPPRTASCLAKTNGSIPRQSTTTLPTADIPHWPRCRPRWARSR